MSNLDNTQSLTREIKPIAKIVSKHHLGAYAAQASYYFILSMIPMILLMMTLVKYTNLTEDMVKNVILKIFPTTVQSLITSMLNQGYRQSFSVIPITILVAVWSAGKGVMSITYGLNLVYEKTETRGYFYIRIRSCIFTFLFIAAIILSLVLAVFGNSIAHVILDQYPSLRDTVMQIMDIKTFVFIIFMTLFWAFVYRHLPNHAARIHYINQIPGAFVTAMGWSVLSKIFSMYLTLFEGFTNIYGSMTTIIIMMLWLDLCMYMILIGGEVNALIEEYRSGRRPQEDE